MISQLYLAGRLAAVPEISQTKKGSLQVKILLTTELVRNNSGELKTESVILPILCYSREAEALKESTPGDYLTVGVHLYATRYEAPDGKVSHGVRLVADDILGLRKGGSR
jgi:single-stranded DNA-binding protein